MKKNQGIVRYLEFLVARDGDADLLRHGYSKREAFLDNLARSPVSSYALIDHATYFRNRPGDARSAALSRVCSGSWPRPSLIKPNALGAGLTELLGRVNAQDPARFHVTLQEAYHTRILPDIVEMLACRCPRARREFPCAL